MRSSCPASDIEAQTEAKLKEVGKTAKIAGFRPGHIPVNLLKQRYGKSIMGEVLEKSVHDATHKVINEKSCAPRCSRKSKSNPSRKAKTSNSTWWWNCSPKCRSWI